MCLHHPETIPPPHPQIVGKLPSTKPVPGAKQVGDCCFMDGLFQWWEGLFSNLRDILFKLRNYQLPVIHLRNV